MKAIKSRGVIRLSAQETKVWEDGGPDGYKFRASVRDTAREMAQASGKPVEIYASKSEGGWCADQIVAEAVSE
jgi:hypothetical protein